jgi:hypothetical protein
MIKAYFVLHNLFFFEIKFCIICLEETKIIFTPFFNVYTQFFSDSVRPEPSM